MLSYYQRISRAAICTARRLSCTYKNVPTDLETCEASIGRFRCDSRGALSDMHALDAHCLSVFRLVSQLGDSWVFYNTRTALSPVSCTAVSDWRQKDSSIRQLLKS